MKKFAVIVAGGTGSRMGGGIPKQFRSLCGRPLLWWSMKAFHIENPDTELILVLAADFMDLWNDFFMSLPYQDQFKHKVTTGGATRTESVNNGLKLIIDEDSLVAVHDGARPLVSCDLISKGWKEAEINEAAIPIVPVTDSLRKLSEGESVAVSRSDYVSVQTPQVFRTGLLKKAYAAVDSNTFTDDASVVEHFGHKVSLFEGNPTNIKVTNPGDMLIAAALMGKNA